MAALVSALINQPLIRMFLMELFARVLSELLAGSKSDPAFKAQFLSLSAQLGDAETEEEKRRVLDQIKALRPAR